LRLNKFISDTGICSRREADRLIEQGLVQVNGRVAVHGEKVAAQDQVTIDGRPLRARPEIVYLAYYKPVGVVSTTDLAEPDNIISAINYPQRIFPVGRLDKYSEGLILLTNEGDAVNKILRAGNAHEKEYRVTVDRPLEEHDLRKMREGIPMLGTVTQPCRVEALDATSFRIVLTQGLNRQIRRMCEFLGYRVLRLIRTRIMHLQVGRLRPGQWRQLAASEVAGLDERLRHSSKTREASLPGRARRIPAEARDSQARNAASGRARSRAGQDATSRNDSVGRVRPTTGGETAVAESGRRPWKRPR